MNAMTPPPAPVFTPPEAPDRGEKMFVTLAREIAMDIYPLDEILKNHEITQPRWDEIRANARFQGLLVKQMEEWNSALNTADRVKLKALSCIEEAMPEFYGKMHSPNETLPAKVRALEVFASIAGLGKNAQGQATGGEKFSVTINLGDDKQLKISAPTIDAKDM